MTRKQRERANAKYDRGLGKKLRRASFSEWESILEDSLHHILKNNKPVMEN